MILSAKFDAIKIPSNLDYEGLIELRAYFRENREKLDQQFIQFEAEANALLKMAYNLILTLKDTEPGQVEDNLNDLNAVSASLGQFVVYASKWLTIYSVVYYSPKQPKFSEADRKLDTDVKLTRQASLYDLLRTMEDKLEKKISSTQSILSTEKMRMQVSIGRQ